MAGHDYQGRRRHVPRVSRELADRLEHARAKVLRVLDEDYRVRLLGRDLAQHDVEEPVQVIRRGFKRLESELDEDCLEKGVAAVGRSQDSGNPCGGRQAGGKAPQGELAVAAGFPGQNREAAFALAALVQVADRL